MLRSSNLSRTSLLLSLSLTLTLGAGLSGCRDDEKKSDDSNLLSANGCIQGVVVDGLTGERLQLQPSAVNSGVNVLVRSELRGASLMTEAVPADKSVELTETQKAMAGEYSVCNIPVDQAFPLFVWMDGYAPYESLVTVRSTVAARSPQARQDVVRGLPTELINIRMFPKNQAVKDLVFQVSYSGQSVKGASIQLRPTGENFLDPAGSLFHPPVDARQVPLAATTDDSGKAVFSAKDLVLGGHYTYVVLPPNGGSHQTVAADTVVVGLTVANAPGSDRPEDGDGTAATSTPANEPYFVHVDLKNTIGALHELSRSTENQDPDATGRLTIFFNREIEIVPGTYDSQVAALTGNSVAALRPNQAGNDQAEQVKITVDGNVLTIEPVFERMPSTDIRTELSLAVSYSGIFIRPKQSPQTGVAFPEVTGQVKFYR